MINTVFDVINLINNKLSKIIITSVHEFSDRFLINDTEWSTYFIYKKDGKIEEYDSIECDDYIRTLSEEEEKNVKTYKFENGKLINDLQKGA